MLLMAPTEQASTEPAGETFDLMDDVNRRFAAPVHSAFYLVEARAGDVLTQPVLWELYQNSTALLDADERGGLTPPGLPADRYLYTLYDSGTGRETVGILGNVAFAVQQALTRDPRPDISLETATTDMVKVALHHLFADASTERLVERLGNGHRTEKRTVLGQEIDYWTAPALAITVLSDNDKLGGGTYTIRVGGGGAVIDKERFNRKVQAVLRGEEESYLLWGVATDVNLEAEDQGRSAGIYIMLTVIGAVLIAGLSLRSYWATALTGAGLAVLIIWLKGVSALIGLKGGLINDLIVPIAMVSLGVDFAVHAVTRYRQEWVPGRVSPNRALRIGLTGVLGALLLAMLSDSIAFLSNLSSGIEGIIHFGVAAAIATVSSFVILGLLLPLTLSTIDRIQHVDFRPSSPSLWAGAAAFRVLASIAAAAVFGVAVILMVALSPLAGMGVLALGTVVFVVLPIGVLRWWGRRPGLHRGVDTYREGWQLPFPNLVRIEGIVTGLAHLGPVVLFAAAVVTCLSTWRALDMEPTFDARDFYDSESDLVVGLDKFDRYIGDRYGESGLVYVRGDLTDPDALKAIDRFIERLPEVPQTAQHAATGSHALSLVRDVTGSAYARSVVEEASGLAITDADGDGIPDSPDQIAAIYDHLVVYGLPRDEQTLQLDPDLIKGVLYRDPSGEEEDVTVVNVGLVRSREISEVAAAERGLRKLLPVLEEAPSITRAGLTGSPFTRHAQVTATTRALQTSVPIAAVGAFLLLLVATRSFRYALVTIIPIGLVVAWLYGFMSVMGFALNFVTATIGAVSIGVGIDFSIHMTERFREELRKVGDKHRALRRAASGTGVALVASAASSIVGFGIMGFAPMPMFAAYGQLTAVMIFLALTASLVVLPSLLLMVTRDGHSGGAAQAGTTGRPDRPARRGRWARRCLGELMPSLGTSGEVGAPRKGSAPPSTGPLQAASGNADPAAAEPWRATV